ncbi:MAG: PD-(D/E)XK nuclease family transposase [Candidatus Electrothrix sp. GW3-4]|uniref:PD-(D/E)XK nuclease family transposase n=1 Tax=Candidatus Electrothrix sp. GW3-4 TaxID=3126740 RepID=UPI0030D52645
MRKLISFDWAMKKLLRSKANFEILEGFLSELLKEDIHILDVLESESNKEEYHDKFNRVDLKVNQDPGRDPDRHLCDHQAPPALDQRRPHGPVLFLHHP